MIIEEKIIFENLNKIKNSNFVIFNNFNENSIFYVEKEIQDKLKVDGSNEIVKINNIDDFEKKLNEIIHSFSIFESKRLFIIIGNPKNEIIKKVIKENNDKFIFFTQNYPFKNLDESLKREILFIDYPKNIIIYNFVKDYFKDKDILINNESLEYLSILFLNYTVDLGIIIKNIELYCKENKIKNINREIVEQFVYFSSDYMVYQIVDFLYKRKKENFFSLYFQTITNTEGFTNFFFFLLQDVKKLIIVGEFILKEKEDENKLLNYFNSLNINYNKFRLKYDIEKIKNFGLNRFYKLLSFLIYINYLLRKFNYETVKNIFEVYISSLFE
jgi:hypothetical protein